MRKSGDAYITHPLAVTTILAELGMTPPTLAAALLHDTVEDTAYSLDELRRDFGDEIAMLVDGVTKLDKVTYGEAAQAETVRKMVIAMARDIRVLVIKLADRLHNARTWRYVSAESAKRKANETLEIYAPLAHRLGMNTIKWELEDLSFATLYPKVYDEIVRLVAERAPAREEYLAGVRDQVTEDLTAAKIKAVVTGRPKHYYSVYQKMIVRGRDFEEIYDLVAVRVLVDTVRDCYAALGALHSRWNPVPGRFKDYIAMPKFNMYQSLHTTVIGPAGQAGRDPDPHAHDAPPRRVRRRRALEVQGPEQRRRPRASRRDHAAERHGLAAPAARLAARDRGPGRVPRLAALRDGQQRGLRLHPEGVGRRAARGRHARRLRVCRPHRGRPPLHRRARQRAARPARVDARERRRRRGADVARPTAPGRRATGSSSSRAPGPATRSSSGSPRSAARRPSRPARTRSPRRCASRTSRSSGS